MKKLVLLLHVAVLLLPGCHSKGPLGVSSGDIEVSVLDEDSRPLAEAWVMLAAFDTTTVLTDSTGRCLFTDVPTIPVIIHASKYRHQHTGVVLEVEEGRNTVALILPSLTTYTIPVGSDLEDLASDADGQYAYVADSDNGRVLRVWVEKDSIVARIIVGTGIRQLALSPDGNALYLANTSNQAISILDLASQSIVATQYYGFQPWDMAATEARLYVTASDYGQIQIIDAQSLQLLGTTGTYFGSNGLVEIGADPDILYIAVWEGIYTYSVSSDSVLAHVTMHWVADHSLNRQNTRLYVALEYPEEVRAFVPPALQLVGMIPLGFEPYSVTTSTDDAALYVGGGDYQGARISGFDTATYQLLSDYTLTDYDRCHSLLCLPSGTKLYSIAVDAYSWDEDILVTILE